MSDKKSETYNHIHQGSVSLSGFFLALFSYSYMEYKQLIGLNPESALTITILLGLLLTVCSILSAVTFYACNNENIDSIGRTYIGLLITVAMAPLFIWLAG